MKKIFFLILLILIPLSVYADTECISGEWIEDDLSGYSVYEGKVYHSYCVIQDADPNTFEEIKIEDNYYAKDANYLFYGVKTLEGINPDNFKSKKLIYDKHSIGEEVYDVYYVVIYNDNTAWLDTMEITDADIGTLEVVDKGYLKDRNNVYEIKKKEGEDMRSEEMYYIEILPNSNPTNFSFDYTKTDDAVYWYGEKMDKVDLDSFEIMPLGYAKDKNNVYYEGQVMYEADTKTFHRADIEGVDIYVYIDNKHEYDDGKSFQTINELENEYIENNDSIKESIKNVVDKEESKYETEYPGYEPQPAKPPIKAKNVWPYAVGTLVVLAGGVGIVRRKKK